MNTIVLLQSGINVLIFLAAVWIGRRHPVIPLIAFVWVAPYLGGNIFGGLYLPFAPAHALGFGIAALVLTNWRPVPADVDILRKRVYVFLGICVAAGLVGICLVYFDAQFIDQWRQTPAERVLRATGAEVLRWMLLIAPVTLAARERLSRKLVRHAILAGLFYCALGLVQFGMEQSIHYDPFPIARGSLLYSSEIAQSLIGSGLEGRITGVCGEPRYLSAYCCLWFFLTALLGKRVGLAAASKILIASVFLLTMVLTGSRTGLLILMVTGMAVCVAVVISGRLRLLLPILAIALLLAGIFGTLVIQRVGSFGARNNTAENLNDSESYTVGGMHLPIEWGDVGGLSVMMRNPWQLVTGMGPGLWQYYENPWDHQFVRTYFLGASAVGLDSVKPDLQLIARLSDVGLVGLCAMVAVLVALYRHGKSGTPVRLREEYLVSFVVLATILQIPGMADQLAFLMMGVVVQVYWELGVIGKAKNGITARTRLRRPEYTPSPVGAA